MAKFNQWFFFFYFEKCASILFANLNPIFLFVLIGYIDKNRLYLFLSIYMEANISTFLNLKISRAQGSILPIHTVVKRHILFWKKKSSNCWLAFLELFIRHVLLVTKNITLCACTFFRFHFLNWILHSEPLQTYSHLTAVLRCKPHMDILTATSFQKMRCTRFNVTQLI